MGWNSQTTPKHPVSMQHPHNAPLTKAHCLLKDTFKFCHAMQSLFGPTSELKDRADENALHLLVKFALFLIANTSRSCCIVPIHCTNEQTHSTATMEQQAQQPVRWWVQADGFCLMHTQMRVGWVELYELEIFTINKIMLNWHGASVRCTDNLAYFLKKLSYFPFTCDQSK